MMDLTQFVIIPAEAIEWSWNEAIILHAFDRMHFLSQAEVQVSELMGKLPLAPGVTDS